MNYAKIIFTNLTKEQITALEGLLSDETTLLGHELTHNSFTTYSAENELPKDTLDHIAQLLNINYAIEIEAEQNWNATWEAEFHPIAISDFVYIKADFHALPEKPFEHIIHITPKMSFGTGHHDTTQLVMKQMRHINFDQKRVFDFGTGTGVLAILAEKLGATYNLATDNDHWSIENSLENVARNNCSTIEVSDIDITNIDKNTPYDVILANINRQILLAYMSDLKGLLAPKGTLIMSGFLKEDIPLLEASIATNNMVVDSIKESNNWICIQAMNN